MISFLLHLLSARRRHGVHSPFVYGFGDRYLRNDHFGFSSLFSEKNREHTIENLINDIIQYCHIREVTNPTMLHISAFSGCESEDIYPALSPAPYLEICNKDSVPLSIEQGSVHISFDKNIMTNSLQKIYNNSEKPLLLLDLYYMEILVCHHMITEKQYYKLK